MEAKELRLGNYVIVNHKWDRNSLVDWIGKESIECLFLDGMAEDMSTGIISSPERVLPIPITEEWLFKLGFEKSDSNYGGYLSAPDREGSSIRIRVMSTNDFYYSPNELAKPVFIKSVHQLQNLYFALTGEELTVKET